ncbi:MAG: tRNA (5-methylaminomethyl-2-thiouridine)(34)-methyltransferase MnmD [bacterium]|nr:tRNA (5-methylaminomethyl-2-thiouridine)(34)-methyltransferase MnmD [bacterium]
MKNELSVVFTADGSHSLWSSKFQEEYHSSRGAIIETQHIYIDMGLKYVLEQIDSGYNTPINIFELSLGTGLSAVMSALCQSEQVLNYDCIEPYPISIEQARALNYGERLNGASVILDAIHKAEWEVEERIQPHFNLTKQKIGITEFQMPKDHYHIIYMDAFSPKIQPDMWSPEVLSKLYEGMRVGGVLVTYSAAGFVRRHFQSLNAQVERLRGANGKREMLRITKTEI